MMKMLKQNGFQQCFWSWKSLWYPCISAEGDYLKGMVGSRNLSYGRGI
jgi:hypothetical protein